MAKRGRKKIIGGRTNISIRVITKNMLDSVKNRPNEPYWHVIDRLIGFWKYDKEKDFLYEQKIKMIEVTEHFVETIKKIKAGEINVE